MVVVKQPVPIGRRFFLQRRDRRAVHEIYIEVAVPVIVNKATARNHGFNLILVRGGRSCRVVKCSWSARRFLQIEFRGEQMSSHWARARQPRSARQE